ncbi:hypothetical protein NKH77_28650 [Streptomyces sp. M19]
MTTSRRWSCRARTTGRSPRRTGRCCTSPRTGRWRCRPPRTATCGAAGVRDARGHRAVVGATGRRRGGVRLKVDDSVSVLLPREDGTRGEPLFRIEPEFLTPSGASEHAFTRDFAQMVAGESAAPLSHMAFRGPTGDVVATAPVSGATAGRSPAPTTWPRPWSRSPTARVPPRTSRPGGRRGRRARTSASPAAWSAPHPGRALRPGAELRAAEQPAAHAVGQRRAADRRQRVRVGAGRRGLPHPVDQHHEQRRPAVHAQPRQARRPGGPHAPYHFAQVVLASEDGSHQITLENENHTRGGMSADVLDGLIDENLSRYSEDELTELATAVEQRLAQAPRDGTGETEIGRLTAFARVARALVDVHQAQQLPWYFDESTPSTRWRCARWPRRVAARATSSEPPPR